METAGTLTGRRGVRLIYSSHVPAGAVRAVVVLAHGYGEHRGRYAHVVAALAARGYAVYALDHRGHGGSGGPRAVVDRFDDFVEDLHVLAGRAKTAYRAAPLCLVGHSMGGLIALRYALRHQPELQGLIVSGAALRFGEDTPAIARRLSGLLARLAPNFPIVVSGPRGESLLSRDPRVQERFAADPLCYTGPLRLWMAHQLLQAAGDARRRLEELTLPLLVMHGEEDRFVLPSGSSELFRRARSADKTLKLWPGCRHEVFNEPEQGEVIAYLLEWLDRRTETEGRVGGPVERA